MVKIMYKFPGFLQLLSVYNFLYYIVVFVSGVRHINNNSTTTYIILTIIEIYNIYTLDLQARS